MGAMERDAQRSFGQAVLDLATAQKSSAGVPAYTRYVNRPLGRRAAAAAYVLGLTPNQVTLLSGLISGLSIAALVVFEPSWLVGVIVGAGLILGYILDSADGQLARLRGGGTLSGEWLDHVVDSARMPALHLGVLIGLFRFQDHLPSGFLLIPIGYLLVSVVRFFALILAEQMRRYGDLAGRDGAESPDSFARSLLALPGDFGILCMIFLAWGSLPVFLTLYGALFVANAALLALSLIRRYRDLRPSGIRA